MGDVMIVGMAGGTASGKTTITRRIAQELGNAVTVISHDSYYRAHHELSYEERTKLNYDHPDSYETELLVEHLQDLRNGWVVEVPVYDFPSYDRTDKVELVAPSPVIIVEGILIFAHAELRELMDLKVFADCDADVRILRRITRDVQERGRSLETVAAQYLTTVKPMHERYVEPYKSCADVIIPTDKDNSAAIRMLIDHIRAHAGASR